MYKKAILLKNASGKTVKKQSELKLLKIIGPAKVALLIRAIELEK